MFRQLLRTANERLRLLLSERGRRARVTVCGGSLVALSRPRDLSRAFATYFESEARGLKLLKEWLSPEQFAQYDAKSYFEVHRLPQRKAIPDLPWHLDEHLRARTGRPRVGLCFVPKGYLVSGDVMLAQKIALEPTSVAR